MKIKSDYSLNHIKNNSNNINFILFYGPNIGLVNLLFNTILNTLSIDVTDPFSVSRFDSQILIENPHIISDTISTFSITSDRRIVLLDLSNSLLKKSIIDDIKSSVSNEVSNYLIIIKSDNLGSQNELVKFTQDSKIGVLVPCYEETINQVKFELSKIFNENNLSFSDSFLLELTSKFSNDTSINKMEFDKLKNFLTNNNNISEKILLNLITDNTNINLNKISHFCAMGDVKNALFFYEKTLDSSISPIIIIRTLINHFKLIEKIVSSVEGGQLIENVINTVKPTIFFKDKPNFSIQSRIWSLQKITLVLKRLIDTEIKSKSGLFSNKILVAQLILSTSVIAKNTIKP